MKRVVGYGIFAVVCILTVCFLISRTGLKNINHSDQDNNGSALSGETLKEGTENAGKEGWSVPAVYKEETSDILAFDAKVIVSESFKDGIFYKTEGHYQEYDEDAFYQFFFSDKTVVKEEVYEMNDRKEEKKEGRTYWSDDNCSICFYPTDAIFSIDSERDYYFYGFCDIVGNLTMYNADKYSLSEELSFMTREKAEEKVQEALEGMGFYPGDTMYQAYALDAATLCEESERVYGWGFTDGEVEFRTKWDVSQEAYAFEMWQICQGLPVWTALISPIDIVDESKAPIAGIYCRDGFVTLHVTDIMDFEISEKYDVLLPFEEIVHKISNKYGDLIMEDRIVIEEMRLCALTNRDGRGGCMVLPVWICTGRLAEAGNMEQMIFDAVTGDEMYAN